jgi:hypothetical protein
MGPMPGRAKLIADIDPSRVEARSLDVPAIGDIVELDQGAEDENGLPMSLVYCRNPDGSTRWDALVYDYEFK